MSKPDSEAFRGISPAEFFYRNRQMAGFGNPTQALYTTVRELVENSLDSCEDARVLPNVDVNIFTESPNACRVTVSDNGTGVPDDKVPDAFARVLYGSKYSSKQQRGTFGLGVTMSILYGQITTDRPAIVHTRFLDTKGMEFRLFIDVENNMPIIESSKSLQRDQQGTTVSVTLNADLKRAKDRILEYLRLSTISTPYAKITLQIDDLEVVSFGAHTADQFHPPVTSLPHPRAADLELLRRLVSINEEQQIHDFLIQNFQQVGQKTAERFLKFANIDPRTIVGKLDRTALSYLSNSLRRYAEFGKPTSDCLSPIGKDAFLSAIRSEYGPIAAVYAQRGPLEWDGFPYIIEGVLASGESFEKSEIPTLVRFANRVPLLYDAGDDIFAKILKRVPWTRYGIQGINRVSVFMHLCSTKVPYSAAGKQSISSVGDIESEILAIYRDLGRKLKKLSDKRQKSNHYYRKYGEFSKTFKLLVKFSGDVAGVEELPETTQMIRELFEVNIDV